LTNLAGDYEQVVIGKELAEWIMETNIFYGLLMIV
jgi:hypothetical protein